MGTSTSTKELVGKIHRFTQEVDNPKPALIEAAEAGKVIFKGAAQTAGAYGALLSDKRKRIGVKDDFIKHQGQDAVVILYTGPAHLLNNPTSPHRIYRNVATARGRGARRANRAASLAVTFGGTGALTGGSLKFAGENYRKTVNHPGTPGKDFYVKAKLLSVKTLPPVVRRRLMTQPLNAVFGR